MRRALQHKMNEMSFQFFWKLQKMRSGFRDLWEDEEGIGTIELVLILVVLVGLVAIFKDKLKSLINSMFNTITSQAGNL